MRYLQKYSREYKVVISIKELAQGGEAVVYQLDHTGREEVVIKKSKVSDHNFEGDEIERQQMLQGMFAETQKLKLLASDFYIC